MGVELTNLHWLYSFFVLVVLGTMLVRKDTIIPCVLGIFVMGWVGTNSIVKGAQAIFNSVTFAAVELSGVIMVISLIVAMSLQLQAIGANKLMIRPLAPLISSPGRAFWVVGACMLVASLFFWPTPATALVGAVFLPLCIKAGLPAMGVAVALNLFGHGLSLSGDYIIQGAPTITAKAAGIPVQDVMSAGFPLWLTMGVVTIASAYLLLRRDMRRGTPEMKGSALPLPDDADVPVGWTARMAAVLVPVLFLIDIVLMLTLGLRGGDATALIGGTALLVLIVVSVAEKRWNALDDITDHVKGGMTFGIQVFGPILPIAGFFFLGELGPLQTVMGNALPSGSAGILSDLGTALANAAPMTVPFSAMVETGVGAVTGLDGSGFSGMSLAGTIGKVFGTALGSGIATLTALGQMAAIYVGGGTIVPWALIPVAAICGVKPLDLARRNFLPVAIGLVCTTIVAMFLI